MDRFPKVRASFTSVTLRHVLIPTICFLALSSIITQNAPKARLKLVQVAEIRRLYATGQFSQDGLAALFGICQSAISSLILKRSWRV
jgi:hypothetical protein